MSSEFKSDFSDSSIPGIRYIINTKSPKKIRIFWTLSFSLSILGLIFYTFGVYHKWRMLPDIGITENLIPIQEIPFPAVTICPPISVKNEYANLYKAYMELNTFNISDIDSKSFGSDEMLSALVQSCYPNLSELFSQIINNSHSNKVIKNLIRGSFNKNEIFYMCNLNRDINVNCSEMFSRIFTDHGICYSYNMQGFRTIFNENVMDKDFYMFSRKGIRNVVKNNSEFFNDKIEESNWTLHNGYNSNDEAIYPLRIASENTVEYILQHPRNQTFNYCPTLRNSYKVIFHMPNEIPTRFHDYMYSSMGSQFLISMTAKHYKTDDSLKDYLPMVRRCFFWNERKLKFFKSYTQSHCELECLANFTLKSCGCVKFSMPRTSDTRVCNLKEMICLQKAIRQWPNQDEESFNSTIPCKCYPPCFNIKYSMKLIDHVDMHSSLGINVVDTNQCSNEISYNSQIYSSIKIIFDDFSIDEQIHFTSYTLENLIAECGGLLGLFMGCSVLSIVELIYLCLKKIVDRTAAKFDKKKNGTVKKDYLKHSRILDPTSSVPYSNFKDRKMILERQGRIKDLYKIRKFH